MDPYIFLIVDDDPDDRMFFKDALRDLLPSAVCMEAHNGVTGLLQLTKAEQLPDFIFLDVNMPRMDGKECLKQLKKDEKLRHIPVIMYSTFFLSESIEEFRTIGASGYLTKPMDMNTLPAKIREAMKGNLMTILVPPL